MSRVTLVRLYRITVDELPLEYTNVAAVVLNSSLKDNATGIKRYLDGVATLIGQAGGTTYYFFVELIDARSKTAIRNRLGAARRSQFRRTCGNYSRPARPIMFIALINSGIPVPVRTTLTTATSSFLEIATNHPMW
jgi:hypothetical protein